MERSCADLFCCAVFQRFLADGKYAPGLDIDVAYSAGASGLVGELRVIATGRHSSDAQPFVEIDAAVRVVLALIRTPLCGADRRQAQMSDRLAGKVPEPGSPFFCAQSVAGERYRQQQNGAAPRITHSRTGPLNVVRECGTLRHTMAVLPFR